MTLKQDAFDFLDRSSRHASLDSLYADFQGLIEAHGFPRFVVTGIPAAGERIDAVILRSTYPEDWSRRYREKRLHLRDPVALMSVGSTQPFTWAAASERFGSERAANRFMLEASEAGLRDGFVTPMFDATSMQAVVSLAADRPVDLPRQEQGALAMASIYLKMAIDDLRGHVQPMPSPLTEREREVLHWCAAGKSAWDISEILGISEGTIRVHLQAIRGKLNALNTTHAVTKAIRRRLISP